MKVQQGKLNQLSNHKIQILNKKSQQNKIYKSNNNYK